jgi:hypothetical protein
MSRKLIAYGLLLPDLRGFTSVNVSDVRAKRCISHYSVAAFGQTRVAVFPERLLMME